MYTGAGTKRGFRFSSLRLTSIGLALLACGGRTLDDGSYDDSATGNPSNASSCSYQGRVYVDGSAIAADCFCFCNDGQIECEKGCSIASAGASSSGANGGSAGYAAATSSGGAASAGAGGSAIAGSTSIGGNDGTAGGYGTGADSSTAGSYGTGGSYGTAGGYGTGGAVSACGLPPRSFGGPELIDDMEDGDAAIITSDGRSGVWFSYNEGSAAQGYQFPSPDTAFSMLYVPSDATGGMYVANTFGQDFFTWGAGMGFVLNNGCPYDASAQKGVHFFAKGDSVSTQILVLLPTSATTPTSNNGTCISVSSSSCYDDYQVQLDLTSTWAEVYVPYNKLRQLGWGTPVIFDPSTLMGVNFQTLYGGGAQFSFSIDAISFY